MKGMGRIVSKSFMVIMFLVFLILLLVGVLLLFRHRTGSLGKSNTTNRGDVYFERFREVQTTGFDEITHSRQIETNDVASSKETNSEQSSSNGGKFSCHATCFCENPERRSSIPLISRSITYLVLSISSLVAYEKSKLFFENECQNELSNHCRLSTIHTSINDCLPVVVVDEVENEEEKNVEQRVYYCYGNCRQNLKHRSDASLKQFERNGIDCAKLRQEAEVVVHEVDLMKSSPKGLSKRFCETARHKFQEDYLVKFCKDSSEMVYRYEYSRTKDGKASQKVTNKGFGCYGRSGVNVRCLQIEPELISNTMKEKFWKEKEEWDNGFHSL